MDLIKIQAREIAGEEVNSVDARELWLFLGVGKDFTTWLKDRIAKYGFNEDIDFRIFPNSGGYSQPGKPQKVVALSMEMAKELSMVENNDKGKEARRYFIECERKAKAAPATDMTRFLNDPAYLRTMLIGYSEKLLEAESTIAVQAPKVEAFERITASEGSLCITDAAKSLEIQPKRLFDWLARNKWIYRRQASNVWIAYQNRLQQGVMEMKVSANQTPSGEERIVEQARVTPKGLSLLAETLVDF